MTKICRHLGRLQEYEACACCLKSSTNIFGDKRGLERKDEKAPFPSRFHLSHSVNHSVPHSKPLCIMQKNANPFPMLFTLVQTLHSLYWKAIISVYISVKNRITSGELALLLASPIYSWRKLEIICDSIFFSSSSTLLKKSGEALRMWFN